MSQIDDELRGTRRTTDDMEAVISFHQRMNEDIGSVTSRDQIIDPYSLVNPNNYRKTRAGQAQYKSDLDQAIRYAEQQEAAYLEWYNSPEQQANRDRAAGLNPDIVGLSGSEGSDTQPSQSSPIDGQPTNGQLAFEGINAAVSLFSAASSLAALPVTFKQSSLLIKQIEGAQLTNDALELGNISAFEQLAHKGISDKFATYHATETAAGRAVDVASWFADDNNFSDILESYAPSNDPRYSKALERVRKGSESIISDSYKTNTDKVLNQSNFARNLANPYVDQNTLVMSAYFEPIANAIFELEKQTADFQKMVNDTKMKYMDSLDPSGLAESFNESERYDALLKGHEAVIASAKRYCYENLKATYEMYPNSPSGQQSLAMIMGHYPSSVEQFLVGYLSNLLNSGNVNVVLDGISKIGVIDLDENSVTNEGALGYKAGRPSK